MSKLRKAQDQWDFLEQIGLIWQEYPELSFGKLIYRLTRSPTELYMLKDKELLQRLQEEYKND